MKISDRIFAFNVSRNALWFRIFGYGLRVMRTKNYQPSFSERYGYIKTYNICGLNIKWLRNDRLWQSSLEENEREAMNDEHQRN
jgi:hypothetical protein